VGVGPLAGVQRDAGNEGVTECVAELAKPAEVTSGYASGGLDLERDHGAVVTFDDQVDLVSVIGAPVAGAVVAFEIKAPP
jgi:hypothetical protein